MIYCFAIVASLLPLTVLGQTGVVGSATGFASGVTGGGDATAAAPSDITELTEWLTDDTPRVILIDKEFNFIGSEGTTTDTGCIPDSNTCGDSGQNAINGADWCTNSDYPSVSVTYDTAGVTPIDVASDKSIVGVGDAGVIRGKGLRLANGATNVIIQNIHITELNPEYIWGGDAITLAGTDLVWIDHCKISLIGRQMLVTGYDQAGRVTISNTEFDGETSWSASCNGEHYWTMLFYGAADQVTLSNNYIHDCSGRGPKVGGAGSTTMHAVNNYFKTIGGHSFDVGEGASVLIEGNYFENDEIPITDDSATAGGYLFNVPDSSAASTCSSYLDRECVVNVLTGSGDFASYTNTEVFSGFSNASSIVEAVSADSVPDSVVANAGVGKLSSASTVTNSTSVASISTAVVASTGGYYPSTFSTVASSAFLSATTGSYPSVGSAASSATASPTFGFGDFGSWGFGGPGRRVGYRRPSPVRPRRHRME